MGKRKTIPVSDAGTWLDGAMGWRDGYRVLYIARDWGWKPADTRGRFSGANWRTVERAIKLCKWGDETLAFARKPDRYYLTTSDDPAAIETYDGAVDWITGQGGLCDEATEYLTSRCPDGYGFVWEAGELSMVPVCDHPNCEYGACRKEDPQSAA